MKTERKFNIDGRVLPNNFEAEQVVLGCALMDSETAFSVIGKLEEIDFYNETHREISGAAPLLVGFGQGEDRIHSPNESFSWRQFI